MSRSGGPNFLGAQFAPFVVEENPDKSDFRVRDVAIPRELTEGRFEGRNLMAKNQGERRYQIYAVIDQDLSAAKPSRHARDDLIG